MCSQARQGKPRATAKSKELEQLELKTKPRKPEVSPVDTGRNREITVRKKKKIGFQKNAQRRLQCQQPVWTGLITWYLGGPARLDCPVPGWVPGTLSH